MLASGCHIRESAEGTKREEKTNKNKKHKKRKRFLTLESTLVAVAWSPSCKPLHTCQHARGLITALCMFTNILYVTHNTRKIYVLSWVNTLSCNPHPRLSHKSKQALGQNLLPVERAMDLWDADAYMQLDTTCFQACQSSPSLQTHLLFQHPFFYTRFSGSVRSPSRTVGSTRDRDVLINW